MSDKKSHKLRPLEDRIAVEAINETEKTISGIIIPETGGKTKPKKGKVVAVGDGKFDNNGKRIPMDVKIGDVVLLEDWGATEVKVEGKELYIIDQGRILAILE